MAMRSICQISHDEFRIKNFGFGGVDPECFYTFLWRPPRIVYLLYRFSMAAFTLSMLIVTAIRAKNNQDAPEPWDVYLTNWSYTSLTIYMLLHFFVTLVTFTYRVSRGANLIQRTDEEMHQRVIQKQTSRMDTSPYQSFEDSSRPVETQIITPKFSIVHMILWLFYTYVSAAAIIVTLVFWIALYPQLQGPAFSLDNLALHLLNTVVILIEHSLSMIPVRLLHAIYPVAYGLIYCIFSAIYWAGDHDRVIYPILNWNTPGPTIGYVLLLGCVLCPLVQLFLFFIYRLKLFIFHKCIHVPL